MNRKKLQALASDWVRMAKNDIRTKANDFMEKVGATPKELAYVLAISEGEMQQILEGNGEITISTFAKLLIATNNVIEIKPISETPLKSYDNIPEEAIGKMPSHPFDGMSRHMPSPPFPPHMRPKFDDDMEDDEDFEDDDEFDEEEIFEREVEKTVRKKPNIFDSAQPRDKNGRFCKKTATVATPKKKDVDSPFDAMSREKLCNIIREKLWDSEIDIDNADKEDLVEFLKAKDERMRKYKRMQELEEDPRVAEFKDRLKKTVKTKPQLREFVKTLVGDLKD